jgi:hypothetical protein
MAMASRKIGGTSPLFTAAASAAPGGSTPDADCADLRVRGIGPVGVIGADVHRLDADGDGWGCE